MGVIVGKGEGEGGERRGRVRKGERKDDHLNSSFNGLAGALSLVFVISKLKLGVGVKRTIKTMVFCTEHVNIGEKSRQNFESNSSSHDYLRKTRIYRLNCCNS